MPAMETRTLVAGSRPIVEILFDGILIADTQDALDLIANAPADSLVLHQHHFAPEFFDLSTRKLGEVLQKFANYQIRVAVIGDFARYPSRAFQAFVYESNQHGQFLFVSSARDVLEAWQAG